MASMAGSCHTASAPPAPGPLMADGLGGTREDEDVAWARDLCMASLSRLVAVASHFVRVDAGALGNAGALGLLAPAFEDWHSKSDSDSPMPFADVALEPEDGTACVWAHSDVVAARLPKLSSRLNGRANAAIRLRCSGKALRWVVRVAYTGRCISMPDVPPPDALRAEVQRVARAAGAAPLAAVMSSASSAAEAIAPVGGHALHGAHVWCTGDTAEVVGHASLGARSSLCGLPASPAALWAVHPSFFEARARWTGATLDAGPSCGPLGAAYVLARAHALAFGTSPPGSAEALGATLGRPDAPVALLARCLGEALAAASYWCDDRLEADVYALAASVPA